SPPVPLADAAPDKLKILMAEDNQINALLARTTLTDAGYEVEVVGDGAAAVEAAQAERFDLILMDMRMPGMDGMEAARRIRALGPPVSETPIIALTANDDVQDRQACLDAGMDAFFTKPMEQARLRRLAKRWTEKPKQAKVG
ncbi:MAG: response regulator, partial [Euryhalocaulis sp.]|uniref:response regulator n=1 Tax=Euryhalocaulis sp. TaxID=2744307 RepID=UPI0017DF0CBE